MEVRGQKISVKSASKRNILLMIVMCIMTMFVNVILVVESAWKGLLIDILILPVVYMFCKKCIITYVRRENFDVYKVLIENRVNIQYIINNYYILDCDAWTITFIKFKDKQLYLDSKWCDISYDFANSDIKMIQI